MLITYTNMMFSVNRENYGYNFWRETNCRKYLYSQKLFSK